MAGLTVLDASVLIAHLNPRDTHHPRATSILLEAAPRSMVVHRLTLAEVLTGAARVGRAAQLRTQLDAAGILLARSDEDEPLRLAELRVSTRLKLPDCCVLDAAIVMQAGLATFDSRLADAARRRGLAVLPTDS